jgi:RHS repeat-associated protein
VKIFCNEWIDNISASSTTACQAEINSATIMTMFTFMRLPILVLFILVTAAFAQTTSDPYRTWAIAQWGAAAVNDPAQEVSVWGMGANPDGDGLTNLQEYCYGTDPRQSTQNPIVRDAGQTVSSYTAITVRHRVDDPALIVFPQYSNDMLSWWPRLPRDSFSYSGANSLFWKWQVGAVSNGMQNVTYVCAAPIADQSAIFTRLAVMRDQSLAIGSPFDSVKFFDSVSPTPNTSVESNSVVLNGFSGKVTVSVAGGAHLIVDGQDVGTSAIVSVGSTVRLRATSPAGVSNSASHTLTIGSFSTTWNAGNRAIGALSGVGATVAGYTPVNASVGPNGDANIGIPITVSPGTGGVEPKLAITYSSQGGNGLLGVGFGISGLSAITRTGSVQYLDGIKSGVSFGSNDRFALDGQRLILASGAYGGEGAQYRTESESFSQVTSQDVLGGSPQHWMVKTKAGLTYYFGYSADSRIYANRSSVQGDTAILSWALTRITDNAGNSMVFTYAAPSATEGGHPRITSITYTENAAAGLAASAEIAFFYEDRPDTRTSYVAGAKVALTKRLLSIECRQGGKVARQYDFSYQQAEISGNSQLTQVLERGKQPASGQPWQVFSPTVFTWQQNAAANMTLSTSAQVPALAQMGFSKSPPSFTIQGDFDGDGRMDIMQLDDHGGSSFWIALGKADGTFDFKQSIADFTATEAVFQESGNLRTGDFNGDGKTDLLYISQTASNNWLALSRGDKTFEVRKGVQLGALQNVGIKVGYTQILTLDVNGDGKTDVVVITPSDSSNAPNRVFLANATSGFTEVADPGAAFKTAKVSDNSSRYSWILPGDYNGDGLPDILHLYYNGQGHWLALSNGDGTFTMRTGSQLGGINGKAFYGSGNSYSYFVTGDFNGDGITDIFCDDTNRSAWQALCKGDGTFEVVTALSSFSNLPTSDPQYTHLYSGDINGDGLSDVFGAYFDYPDHTWLAYSTGNAAFATFLGSAIGALDGEIFYDPEHVPESRVLIGDFDGDGTDDVLDLNYSKENYLCRSNGFNASRIVQVTNGHGGYTKINYEPLTNPSIYTKGATAAYPYCDIVSPMQVVASLVSRNGVDGDAFTIQANPAIGESTTFYHYFNALALLDGHGFQGFSAMHQTSLESGITSRTEYVMTDPNLAGRPSRQVQTLADGHVISETLTDWFSNPVNLPSGKQAHFPIATQTVTRQYEINNAIGSAPVKTTTVSGVAYDAFGNLTDSTTDYGGGFFEDTHSTFVNDTTHWWLGRLSETVVTQTTLESGFASRHSSFEYSPTNGQLTKETIVTPENNLQLEKTYVHDAFGNITQSTLKDLGTLETRATKTTYSADGRFILQTKNSVNQTETKIYDPLDGTMLSQTGPNNLTTRWERDAFGRVLREVHPDGTEAIMQYMRVTPGNGIPSRTVYATLTQASGQPWKYTYYDVLDREIGSMVPHFSGQLLTTHRVFNNLGQTTHVSVPFFSGGTPLYTISQYDAISRATKQTAPGNRNTTTDYVGLTATVTNPKTQKFSTTADLRGRTASSTGFDTDTVTNIHDPYGNLLQVNDGIGNVTTMAYDGRGRKTSMTEPNSGTTTYTYNAFGEITSQTDSLNRTTFLFYDLLGRLVRRLDPDAGFPLETIWEYDSAPNGIGKLARVYRASDGYTETYRYDTLGRLVESLVQIGSMKFVLSTTFDEYGRLQTVSYPTGFAVKNEYNGDGYLSKVRDAGTGFTFWTAVAYNERGQLVEQLLGNGLTTRRAYDANTGLVQTIKTGTGTGTNVNPTAQNLSVQFDSIGNLTQRDDLRRGINESLTYDRRNQLATITGNSSDPITIACDMFGNITSRSDAGTYIYGENGAGPHAVTSIKDANGVTQRTLRYDAAGNCTQDGTTVLSYNSSNQPTWIGNGSATLLFSYTPAHTRYRLIEQKGSVQREKLYIGSLYEREATAAGIVHTHFIPAGGGIVAIHTQTQTLDASSATITASKTRYVHKDHLGSLHTLTREDGTVDEVLDFDAWGRRRTFDSATHRYTYASVQSQTDRGFTGHEMLDAVGLIHMNGRIYDPTLGRFLSVDPLVQEAGNLQNLNRYTYVLNNPLSLTDPSGFNFLGGIGKWIGKNWKMIATAVIAIAVAWYCPIALGLTGTFWGAVAGGAAGGFGGAFTGTLLAGGSIGDAFRAGVTGAVIGGVTAGLIEGASTELGLHGLSGDLEADKYSYVKAGARTPTPITSTEFAEKVAEKVAVHGVIGGVFSELQGGKFIHGFLAGGSTGFASPFIAGAGLSPVGQVTAAAVVGGTASELGGGKFGNGAVTGAFIYLFNETVKSAPIPSSDPNNCASFYNNPEISNKLTDEFRLNAIAACTTTGNDPYMNRVRLYLQQEYLAIRPEDGKVFSSSEQEYLHDNAYVAAGCIGTSSGRLGWIGVNNVPVANWFGGSFIKRSIDTFGNCQNPNWSNTK